MKRFWIIAAVLVACAAAIAFTSRAENTNIKGDYVEVRTASVFAGACHYNGEVVTTGREAIMAWNIASGSWHNTNLAGLRAMASVTSTANLGDEHAARKFELVVDPSASDAQVTVFTDLLRTHS